MGIGDLGQHVDVGRRSLAPSAQLRPIDSGFAWRSEYQNASAVCPDNVRPDASVMVPRSSPAGAPSSSNTSSMANSAALALKRIEDGLHHQDVRAAFDQAARGLAVGHGQFVEVDRGNPGGSRPGQIDAVRLVGPSTPITNRGLTDRGPGRVAGAAREGRAFAFSSRTRCSSR